MLSGATRDDLNEKGEGGVYEGWGAGIGMFVKKFTMCTSTYR